MGNISGIKTVKEIITSSEVVLYDKTSGGRPKSLSLEDNRVYIVPGYQREIKWTADNVQILIDDLCEGKKFLGTITFSTLEPREFEIIDGQQRITVISILISCLNEYVDESKRINNICLINNQSFPYFMEALKNQFDYQKMSKENIQLFNDITNNDFQHQKDDFANIRKSIVDRLEAYSPEKIEDLLQALCESQFNVIVNEIEEGTDSQRKFCVDYFIDINNKSVELDSLDIIRAYAFKEDFSKSTEKWVSLQNKCNLISKKAKYSREDLFYQYFICKVNGEIEYSITKLSKDYRIKEDVTVLDKKYASGTFVWNMFKKDKFYSNLLTDLNEYLDFVDVVLDTETGGANSFKQYFLDEKGNLIDETRILNSHTIINNILRNDDIVPKMLVMKYFLEVLKPKRVKYNNYRIISNINVIATIFTLSKKRKGSEIIAGKLLQKEWQKGIRDYAIKVIQDVPSEIGYQKTIKEDGKATKDSGLRAARRFFSTLDANIYQSGSISTDEEIFKNENVTSGDKNIEHFIINREYSYALYKDGDTIDIEIKLPRKFRNNMATLANYLIMYSDINKELKNMPVYEKINKLEEYIDERKIDLVIPSRESQKHYYLIKKIFYDESKYPKSKIDNEKKKRNKKQLLNDYYLNYFIDEFTLLTENLNKPEVVFGAECDYILNKAGFKKMDRDSFSFVLDNGAFDQIDAEIDSKRRKILFSVEVCNPFYGEEDGQEKYLELIEKRKKQLIDGLKRETEWEIVLDFCEDESVEFTYEFEPEIDKITKFIDELNAISFDEI